MRQIRFRYRDTGRKIGVRAARYCAESMLDDRSKRDEKTSPPPCPRGGDSPGPCPFVSLCVSRFPHSIAMYGTRDDVLSPGPYAHLRRAPTRTGLPSQLRAGIVDAEEDDDDDDDGGGSDGGGDVATRSLTMNEPLERKTDENRISMVLFLIRKKKNLERHYLNFRPKNLDSNDKSN